jgi:ABC-2 type transport system ATP-binding protein
MSLHAERISHRFGSQVALDDVSLTVERGDCYGFLGHNGAGKTTTLRALLGLLRPQSGRVVVDGFDAAAHPLEARARMGGLVETPGFHGPWSAEQNLVLLARLGGMPAARARAESQRLLDLVGLDGAGAKRVRHFSQGMRQRLGVAQVLIGDPDYVLLDEPTNGLDPEGVAEMRALLRRLTEEGKTVLVSSHRLHEVAEVCSRVGVLREGRMVAETSLDELLGTNPAVYLLRTDNDGHARGILGQLRLESEVTARGLRVDPGQHGPGTVVRHLVEAGLDVRAFAPQEPSLEEVYLRYSREERASAPPTAQAVSVSEPAGRRAAPRPLWRMVRHEWRRWTGRLTVPVLLALPAVLGVVAVLRRRAERDHDAERVAAGELASTTQVTAFEGVAVALQAALPLLPYILLGLAGLSLAGEFSQGTLRNVLLRPLRRRDVVLGKATALLSAALGSYLLVAGSAVAAAAWAFDFTDVTEILPSGKRYLHVPAKELVPELRHALAAPLLPLAAYACVGLFLGSFVRRGAVGLALALGAGVFLDVGRDVRALEKLLPSAYLPSPLRDSSFLEAYSDLAQGVSNVSFELAGTEWSVPAIWLGASLGLAVWIFGRRFIP